MGCSLPHCSSLNLRSLEVAEARTVLQSQGFGTGTGRSFPLCGRQAPSSFQVVRDAERWKERESVLWMPPGLFLVLRDWPLTPGPL